MPVRLGLIGPVTVPHMFVCLGCSSLQKRNVMYWNGTVLQHDCAHPKALVDGKPREINECGGIALATPAWCPLLPTRRTIGTCADCADSEPAFAGEKSAGVIHAGLVFCNSDAAIRDAVDDDKAIPSTFGCIHWREEGKS